jgi:hypothetical protein
VSANPAEPGSACNTEKRECVSCVALYGSAEDEDDAFTRCVAAARARGLKKTCWQREGAGNRFFYCAAPAK